MVEKERERRHLLRTEQSQKEAIGGSIRVPVNTPHVVARRVLTEVCEFRGRPVTCRAAGTGRRTGDRAAARESPLFKLPQERAVKAEERRNQRHGRGIVSS